MENLNGIDVKVIKKDSNCRTRKIVDANLRGISNDTIIRPKNFVFDCRTNEITTEDYLENEDM